MNGLEGNKPAFPHQGLGRGFAKSANVVEAQPEGQGLPIGGTVRRFLGNSRFFASPRITNFCRFGSHRIGLVGSVRCRNEVFAKVGTHFLSRKWNGGVRYSSRFVYL